VSGAFCGLVLAGEKVEQFADGGLLTCWTRQREVSRFIV
jgi:hypothetical protein